MECAICYDTIDEKDTISENENKTTYKKILEKYGKITKCECKYVCHEFCIDAWFKTTQRYTCPMCKCSDGCIPSSNDTCVTENILTFCENLLGYIMRFDNGFDNSEIFSSVRLVVQILLILFVSSFTLFIAFIHVIILKKTR